MFTETLEPNFKSQRDCVNVYVYTYIHSCIQTYIHICIHKDDFSHTSKQFSVWLSIDFLVETLQIERERKRE